jgi:hypothetical protein
MLTYQKTKDENNYVENELKNNNNNNNFKHKRFRWNFELDNDL